MSLEAINLPKVSSLDYREVPLDQNEGAYNGFFYYFKAPNPLKKEQTLYIKKNEIPLLNKLAFEKKYHLAKTYTEHHWHGGTYSYSMLLRVKKVKGDYEFVEEKKQLTKRVTLDYLPATTNWMNDEKNPAVDMMPDLQETSFEEKAADFRKIFFYLMVKYYGVITIEKSFMREMNAIYELSKKRVRTEEMYNNRIAFYNKEIELINNKIVELQEEKKKHETEVENSGKWCVVYHKRAKMAYESDTFPETFKN